MLLVGLSRKHAYHRWVRGAISCDQKKSQKQIEEYMEPSWQKVKLIKLVATDAPLWTLVRDYVPSSRLLRFTVVDKDETSAQVVSTWCPADKTTCGPDGMA